MQWNYGENLQYKAKIFTLLKMELQTFITKSNLGENLDPFIIPSFYYNLKNDKNVISYNYLNLF
jgi:hypothetical protein